MHTKRIARGAAWLDKKQPDWYERVNVHMLTPISQFDCVIGQVFGDYTKFMCRRYFILGRPGGLNFLNPLLWMGVRWGISHGFEIGRDSHRQWYKAWRNEIENRRDAARVQRLHDTGRLYVPVEWEREKELV